MTTGETIKKLAEKFEPPRWLRGAALTWLLVTNVPRLWHERGVGTGVLGAVFFGMIVVFAVSPIAEAWLRRHSAANSALALSFFALLPMLLTTWPLWVCALTSLGAMMLIACIGLLLSRRRLTPAF